MIDWASIACQITGEQHWANSDLRLSAVHGGDINQAFCLSLESQRYFVKIQQQAPAGFFAAEADGLRRLAETRQIRVPQVLAWGQAGDVDFLALEWIELSRADSVAQAQLGQQLARLHRLQQPRFGGGWDNWIGTTLQHSPNSDDWVAFYRDHRLQPQLQWARQKGFGELSQLAEPVLQRMAGLFVGYEPQPSLLHGDLWSGNQAMDASGMPVIFDPAVSIGDREFDLAMTELFGGFSAEFYSAYQVEWPLDAGYAQRRDLYQLYHVLNHLNLFGSGYLGQAKQLLRRLSAFVS